LIRPTTMRGLRLLAAGLALTASVAAVACGDDDDDDAEAEVQAAYDEILAITGPEDAEGLVSEDFLENAFGGLFTLEELTSEPPPPLSDTEINVDGDTATVDGFEKSEDLPEQSTAVRWTFVKESDAWKLDDIEPRDYEADDTAQVEMKLQDFAFEFDEDEFQAGEALSITAENEGEQPHLIALVKVDEGVNLQEALETESEGPPEGITPVIDWGLWGPGDSGTVFTTQELESGNYALICFLPDFTDPENKPPHYAQGMLSEFTID
jgi:hypothetical protein